MSVQHQKLNLPCVRLSYPTLFVPKKGDDPDSVAKYGVTCLLDPNKAQHKKALGIISKAIKDLAVEKWGDDAPKAVMPLKVKCALRDGNDRDGKEFEDMYYVAASNTRAPRVVDQEGEEVAASQNLFYPGCYAHVTINLWAQDNVHGKRINANLRAVKFVKDGEPFGASPVDADEEFEDFDDFEDADDEDDFGI